MILLLMENFSIKSNSHLVLQIRIYKLWEILLVVKICVVFNYNLFYWLALFNVSVHTHTHTHICIYFYNNDKNDNVFSSLNARFIHQIFFSIVWVASKNVIHTKLWIFAIPEDFHRNVIPSVRIISVESLSINGLRIELPSGPTWALVVKFWCIHKEKKIIFNVLELLLWFHPFLMIA